MSNMVSQEAFDALFAYMAMKKARERGDLEEAEKCRSKYIKSAEAALEKEKVVENA